MSTYSEVWKIVGKKKAEKISCKNLDQGNANLEEALKKISYSKPLLSSFLVCFIGLFFYLYPPQNPLVDFLKYWCVLQAISVSLNIKEQCTFYAWWSKSGLSDSHRRGLSTNGFPFLGFISFPRLSSFAFFLLSLTYILLLLTCAFLSSSQYIGGLLLITSCVSLSYFASIWAERSGSYHRECVAIAVFLYLAFSPDFYGRENTWPWICAFIKAHLASIYLAGGLQKLACSFIKKKCWFFYTPHTLTWIGMWAKPYYLEVQKFFLRRPYLLATGGFFVLLLELFLFVQFWVGVEVNAAMAIALLAFHTGVFLLQGIDYLTFWCPVFILWFLPSGELNLYALEWTDYLYLLPAFSLCAAQVIYALTFLENCNINIPPFTCCPMFANVLEIKEQSPQYYVMWDMRSPIAFERMEWIYPYIKVESGLGLVESDLSKLPFHFVGFGFYATPDKLPHLQQSYFRRDLVDEGSFFLYTNLRLNSSLIDELRSLSSYLHEDKSLSSQYDRAFLEDLINRYEKCIGLFFVSCCKAAYVAIED
ncbi:MAG: hypothetical protein CMO81_00940 [Waddliaceae bacterium]|nr:hypothetical protein [Waddliaceae bacterium]